jgi:hypothetical protein
MTSIRGVGFLNLVSLILFGSSLPLLISSIVYAKQAQQFNKDTVIEKSACSLRNMDFTVYLTSPSGDSLEDDTNIWFAVSGKYACGNPGRPGYLALLPTSSGFPTIICQNAAAFEVHDDKVAVPLFLSNRPSLDTLAVVIYDPHTNDVLSYTILGEYYGERPAVVAIKGGFSFRAVYAQPNDSPKGLVEKWLNVTWDGKKIIKKWDSSRKELKHEWKY